MKARSSFLVDNLVGIALGTLYVAILLATTSGLGYSRDEGFYFQAATSYANWFEHLLRSPEEAILRGAVDPAWSVNHEHPALVKSLFALSWLFLYKQWHWFAHEGTSFRFGGMVFAGLGLWLLYLWGTRARSRACGLMAAALFAAMPRIFYHAHLDCFDVPIAVMWLFCAYLYWQTVRTGSFLWAIATGIVYGLTLDTKHNAWFLPFALVLHHVLTQRQVYWRNLRRGYLTLPTPLLSMLLLGPAVFVAAWPWLWFDTADRFGAYVRFHLNHDYYNIVFLGQTYWKPPFPFSYLWLMTAATVPGITLLLFAVGFSRVLFRMRAVSSWGWRSFRIPVLRRDDPTGTGWLWAICIFTAYAPWLLSRSTPIFGGTKHWMPAYPFLCLFAGAGFEVVLAQASRWLGRADGTRGALALGWGLGSLLLAPAVVETAHAHPWGLSNYTPLVGGASGAASLGLNRQFWGFTTGAVANYLNDHVKPGESVFIHDTAWPSWDMLHRDGTLLPQVRGAGAIEQSDWALYHHEEHMEGVEYQIWAAYGTATPVHIGAYDGVPIVYVYRKKRP